MTSSSSVSAAGRVAGVNLVYGIYDWGRIPSHLGLCATGGPDLLSPERISFFTDAYLPGRAGEERRAPAVSPAFAGLHGLPPALLKPYQLVSQSAIEPVLKEVAEAVAAVLSMAWREAGGSSGA